MAAGSGCLCEGRCRLPCGAVSSGADNNIFSWGDTTSTWGVVLVKRGICTMRFNRIVTVWDCSRVCNILRWADDRFVRFVRFKVCMVQNHVVRAVISPGWSNASALVSDGFGCVLGSVFMSWPGVRLGARWVLPLQTHRRKLCFRPRRVAWCVALDPRFHESGDAKRIKCSCLLLPAYLCAQLSCLCLDFLCIRLMFLISCIHDKCYCTWLFHDDRT